LTQTSVTRMTYNKNTPLEENSAEKIIYWRLWPQKQNLEWTIQIYISDFICRSSLSSFA